MMVELAPPVGSNASWSSRWARCGCARTSTPCSKRVLRRLFSISHPIAALQSRHDPIRSVARPLQVAAIYDAVHRPVSQHVLWLDLDTWFQRALDSHFWGWLCAFDVATIRRKGYYPDTGITYYQSSSRTQLLLQDARDAYTTSSNFHVSGPRPRWCNDIQVKYRACACLPACACACACLCLFTTA